MMLKGKVHAAVWVGGKLQDGGLQGIAVMADWSLQHWNGLVDCRCKLSRSSSGSGLQIAIG